MSTSINQVSTVQQNATQDKQKTQEFIKDPSSFSIFSYENSGNVAKTFIDKANEYASYLDIPLYDDKVAMEAFACFTFDEFYDEIVNYYNQNGVEFENEDHEYNSVANTAFLLAYAADINVDDNVSANELETILNEIDRHENWQTNLISKSGINAVTKEGLEAMFNILTTGEMYFEKYDQTSHEDKLTEMILSDTFNDRIDRIALERNDIRTSAGAKYREGYELYTEDQDALNKLIDYNHYNAIKWWGYKQE